MWVHVSTGWSETLDEMQDYYTKIGQLYQQWRDIPGSSTTAGKSVQHLPLFRQDMSSGLLKKSCWKVSLGYPGDDTHAGNCQGPWDGMIHPMLIWYVMRLVMLFDQLAWPWMISGWPCPLSFSKIPMVFVRTRCWSTSLQFKHQRVGQHDCNRYGPGQNMSKHKTSLVKPQNIWWMDVHPPKYWVHGFKSHTLGIASTRWNFEPLGGS